MLELLGVVFPVSNIKFLFLGLKLYALVIYSWPKKYCECVLHF
uniref:Uncharacterized protein n=1 Tax=Rhizophora mucronata TaxID=61149 RepID=A0A2P2LL25_RHIMU